VSGHRRHPGGKGRAAGLALVAVLWAVAALTVTATGVLYAVRGEVRSAASFRELSSAGALADAAVVQVARDYAVQDAEGRSAFRELDLRIDDRPVHVKVIQVNGLINLNTADEALLVNLLAVAGGVDRDRAAMVARRIVDWRRPDPSGQRTGAEGLAYRAEASPFRPRGGPFDAVEDLLQVPGVDYALYRKLRPLVSVHHRSRLNPAAAPFAVLRGLAGGDAQAARAYENARAESGRGSGFIAGADEARYQIEASTRLSNGAWLHSRRVVDLTPAASGMPWLTLEAEHRVEPARSED